MLQDLIGKQLKTFKLKTRTLGQGQFGIVVEGIDVRNKEKVAMKIMLMNPSTYEDVKKKALTQISILSQINNENVIKYIDSFETSQFFFIVTEFCNGGDLQNYLQVNEPEEEEGVVMLKQMLNGFKGLHEAGIMHRDLKTANILLHDGVCKIADFGLSKNVGVGNMTKSNVGTPLTNAPEQLAGLDYGFEADIWSIGVVYYRILYGDYPFSASDVYRIQQLMTTTEPNYKLNGKQISPQSIDFIKRCLQVDPKKRIKWREIYRHPLITGQALSEVSSSHHIEMGKTRTKIDEDLVMIQKFYEDTRLVETVPDERIMELSRSIMRIQLEDEEQQAKGLKDAKTKREIVERFEELYLSKREDIMFFHLFIHPHIRKVSYIRANHAVAGFILAKKCYTELGKYHKALVEKRPQFPKQQNFEQFTSYPEYSELTQKIETDLQNVEQIGNEYRNQIKLTTLEIRDEFDLRVVKSWNYNGLMRGIVKEYLKLLYEDVRDAKAKGDNKELLQLVMALEYYGDTERVYAQEFERILANADLGLYQSKIYSKVM